MGESWSAAARSTRDVITVDEEALLNAVSPDSVISALEHAFRKPPPMIPRQRIAVNGGDFLVMPAVGSNDFGIKVITVAKERAKGAPLVQGRYVLFSGDSLAPVGSLEAGALTAIRTAGVSALATKYLARKDSRRLVIFGAGVEAREHLRFILSIRNIEQVRIISRTPSKAADLAAYARTLGPDASTGTLEDVRGADIICTCTTAITPLFSGSLLSSGVHVNAIGTHRPADRELDTEAIRRARVVVESREAALREAGELCVPISEGVLDASHIIADLSETLARSVRRHDDDITIFKSVGLAFEDLAVAAAVCQQIPA